MARQHSTVPRVCGQCGADFLSRVSEVKRGRGLFCTTVCGNASRRLEDPEANRRTTRLKYAETHAEELRDARIQRRERNRAFIAEVNARTVCAHCGAQPIEWHNPEHVELNRQTYRISALVKSGSSIPVIEAEIARCTPLCRRCHMYEDGCLKKWGTSDDESWGPDSAAQLLERGPR